MFGSFQFTPIVRALLIINIAFFFIDKFVFGLTDLFGLRYVLSENFHVFQIFTYMFLHADFGHVFFNMFALFMFGPMLEHFWGPKKFLIFYLVTGLGAAFIYSLVTFYKMYELQNAISVYVANPNPDAFVIFVNKFGLRNFNFVNEFAQNSSDPLLINRSLQFVNEVFIVKSNVPMIGASGAVFGILMAYGMTFPQTELFIFPLPFPIKAWVYVTCYGIIELYSGVRASEGDNVAHFAHLGGMIFAFIMIRMWRKKNSNYGEYY